MRSPCDTFLLEKNSESEQYRTLLNCHVNSYASAVSFGDVVEDVYQSVLLFDGLLCRAP